MNILHPFSKKFTKKMKNEVFYIQKSNNKMENSTH